MASELDAMLTALRALEDPMKVAEMVAREGAPELQSALEASLGAEVSPDGKPWAARKAGGRAYSGAAKAVKTTAHGDLVVSTLSGPEVYGHFGAHGIIERKMLPDAGASIPKLVTDALTRGAQRVFRILVGAK